MQGLGDLFLGPSLEAVGGPVTADLAEYDSDHEEGEHGVDREAQQLLSGHVFEEGVFHEKV